MLIALLFPCLAGAGAPLRVGILDVRGTSTLFPIDGVTVFHEQFLPAGAQPASQLTEQGIEHGNLMLYTLAKQFRDLDASTRLEIYSADVFVDKNSRRKDHHFRNHLNNAKPEALGFYVEGALLALDWLYSQEVKLLVFAGVGRDSPGLRQLVDKAQGLGILVLTSTHNEQVLVRGYPAAYPGVFAVAGKDSGLAIHKDVELATYVDLVTDGSAYEVFEVKTLGSSFAAARAAGMLLAWKATNPQKSFEDGQRTLLEAAPLRPFGKVAITALPTLLPEEMRVLLNDN